MNELPPNFSNFPESNCSECDEPIYDVVDYLCEGCRHG